MQRTRHALPKCFANILFKTFAWNSIFNIWKLNSLTQQILILFLVTFGTSITKVRVKIRFIFHLCCNNTENVKEHAVITTQCSLKVSNSCEYFLLVTVRRHCNLLQLLTLLPTAVGLLHILTKDTLLLVNKNRKKSCSRQIRQHVANNDSNMLL